MIDRSIYTLTGHTNPTDLLTLADGQAALIPYLDNSVSWPPSGIKLPGSVGSLTIGDQATQAATTLFSAVTGDTVHIGGLEMDLCDLGTGTVPGGAYFGVHLTANMRIPFNVFGTVAGWEFNATPYVGTNQLFHAGSLITVQSKTGGYTEAATSGLQVRLCNLAAGFTVVLPPAAGNTARFTFKKMLAAGTITIDGNASETIDGALTATLATQYDKISIISDGSNWWIV